MCQPKCRAVPALKTLFTLETSPLANFINIIIILNVLCLAADADSTPQEGRDVIAILNLLFTAIFMAEVVIKISILGPCLYFNSGFNT